MWAARAGVLAALGLVACNVIFGVSDLRVESAPAALGGSGGDLGGGGTGDEGGHGGVGGVVDQGGAGEGGVAGAGGQGGVGGALVGFCDARFGTLTNYTLCVDSQAFCIFYRTQPNVSCDETCGGGGLECASADNEDPLMVCTSIARVQCADNTLNNIICSCSKTCGVNAPCNAGEVCVNGMCI